MRPVFHPSMDDVRLEAILHALSDPIRANIFANIAQNECALACSAFAGVGEKTIPKSSLSQHFKVLREAGLIRSERRGVELRNLSRCGEIEARFPGLIQAILYAHMLDGRRHATGAEIGDAASSDDVAVQAE